jgi:hypothetical protein
MLRFCPYDFVHRHEANYHRDVDVDYLDYD